MKQCWYCKRRRPLAEFSDGVSCCDRCNLKWKGGKKAMTKEEVAFAMKLFRQEKAEGKYPWLP